MGGVSRDSGRGMVSGAGTGRGPSVMGVVHSVVGVVCLLWVWCAVWWAWPLGGAGPYPKAARPPGLAPSTREREVSRAAARRREPAEVQVMAASGRQGPPPSPRPRPRPLPRGPHRLRTVELGSTEGLGVGPGGQRSTQRSDCPRQGPGPGRPVLSAPLPPHTATAGPSRVRTARRCPPGPPVQSSREPEVRGRPWRALAPPLWDSPNRARASRDAPSPGPNEALVSVASGGS